MKHFSSNSLGDLLKGSSNAAATPLASCGSKQRLSSPTQKISLKNSAFRPTAKRTSNKPKSLGDLNRLAAASSSRHPQQEASNNSSPITDFLNAMRKDKQPRRSLDKASTPLGTPRNSNGDLALQGSSNHSRKSSRRSNSNKASWFDINPPKRTSSSKDIKKAAAVPAFVDQDDVDDIYDMIQELNDCKDGRTLLAELIQFQTGATTQVPRLLQQEESKDEDDGRPPIGEIFICWEQQNRVR